MFVRFDNVSFRVDLVKVIQTGPITSEGILETEIILTDNTVITVYASHDAVMVAIMDVISKLE